jgi:hypothetical protein
VHTGVQLRARPSLHTRAQWMTPREHRAAPGPSAAQGCPHDEQAEPMAAPGPSRTCASGEAARLGARNLCCRVETSNDAAEWTTRQPQPGRAQAAPAAHPCRSRASFPLATTAPRTDCQPQPGRARAAPAAHSSPSSSSLPDAHERGRWRSPSHPGRTRQPPASAARDGAVLTSGSDAPNRLECAAGAARALPGCGWRVVHPAASLDVSTRQHKLRAPSRVASSDAQVLEGPGAAVRSDWSSFAHACAALGPGAALWTSLPSRVHVCAATGAHAVRLTREHAAPVERVARLARLEKCTKRVRRVQRTKGRRPWVLCRLLFRVNAPTL